MGVAKARYTGRMRGQTYRPPSGGEINLPPAHADEWVEIDAEVDAEFLEGKLNVEVEWTATGRLRSLVAGVADSVTDALDALDYSEKQSIVGDVDDLDVAGNAAEDEIDQAIEEYLEEIN